MEFSILVLFKTCWYVSFDFSFVLLFEGENSIYGISEKKVNVDLHSDIF